MSLGLGFPQFGGSPGFTEHNLDVVHEEVMECFPVFRKMKVTAYCDKAMALGQGRNNRTTQPLLLLSLKFARLELLYEVLKILVYRCGRTDAKIDACRPVAPLELPPATAWAHIVSSGVAPSLLAHPTSSNLRGIGVTVVYWDCGSR